MTDEMSDVEKLHVIYDYLAGEVDYDYSALNLYYVVGNIPGKDLVSAKKAINAALDDEANGFSDSMKAAIIAARDAATDVDDLYKRLRNDYLQRLSAFSIEGVLNDGAAVCEGISYTFMLLARIEGIECYQVTGDATNNGSKVAHAWNKVNLDGTWYCIDATWGNIFMNSKKFVTHRYFMVEEGTFSETHEEQMDGVAGVKNLATGDIEYYKNKQISEGHTLYVSNYEDMLAVVQFYVDADCYYMEFMPDPDYDVMGDDDPLMTAFQEVVKLGFSLSYSGDRVFFAYFTLT